MNDVLTWKVHGPVETLRQEFAEWDTALNEWKPVRHFSIASFRPDGSISTSDHHNADGSIAYSRWLYDDAGRLIEKKFWIDDGPRTRNLHSYDETGRHVRTVQVNPDGTQTDSELCTYDPAGRRTKITFFGRKADCYGIEGTDHAYGAPGAEMMTTIYDERDLPAKVILQDANKSPVRSVTLTRDNAGRLLNEQVDLGDLPAFPLDKLPPEERERTAAALKDVFPGTFSTTTYVYDVRGRLIERVTRIGTLGQERTTYKYADRDDPIEQSTEEENRTAGLDDDGALQYTPEPASVQHQRFEYQYDAHGNWTERITSTSIERRSITYHS